MTPAPQPSYTYRASSVRVIDGDTLVLDIDLGLSVTRRETVRLLGVNAPEVVGAEKPLGLKTKARLIELVTDQRLVVQTFKDRDDKYGRLLADVFVVETGESVSATLILESLAWPS